VTWLPNLIGGTDAEFTYAVDAVDGYFNESGNWCVAVDAAFFVASQDFFESVAESITEHGGPFGFRASAISWLLIDTNGRS
jgi:hypothetical protein